MHMTVYIVKILICKNRDSRPKLLAQEGFKLNIYKKMLKKNIPLENNNATVLDFTIHTFLAIAD